MGLERSFRPTVEGLLIFHLKSGGRVNLLKVGIKGCGFRDVQDAGRK